MFEFRVYFPNNTNFKTNMTHLTENINKKLNVQQIKMKLFFYLYRRTLFFHS